MPAPADLIDLHCHVLPGVDDGPAELEDAVALVRGLESIGFKDFYPTPHQKEGYWAPDAEQRAAARELLAGALTRAGSGARIHPAGGENMWDGLFLGRQHDGRFPAYPGDRAFLVEFQLDVLPPHLEEQLFRHRMEGRLPVVAHVERYPALAGSRERLGAVARSAALLVNLPTLGGGQGFWAARAARALVRTGQIHAIATDSHGLEDLPRCRAGLDWIRAKLGPDALQLLLRDNPARIVRGELPDRCC